MSVPVIGIGASAGGLEALREFFGGAEGNIGMAFVVVQHLDPTHESLMSQLIERYTDMTVQQAQGGERMQAENVYIIPPGHGLALNDGILSLTEFKESRGMRRPIDDFFESLADDCNELAACVILSGTGSDGSRGLRAIKENGGLCLAQEPSSARYDGMPTAAINTGLVDIVAHPNEMLDALCTYFERTLQGDTVELDKEAEGVVDHIDELCAVIREQLGYDFSNYKRSTIARRIARRMQVVGLDTARAYIDRVKSDSHECDALLSDLLINVTRFFRDSGEFEALRSEVIDPLVDQTSSEDELRVWVPGCSSGEEAYTIAMLLADALERAGKSPYVQIFATDIDEKMLDIGRNGNYPLSALDDIPAVYAENYVVAGSETFHFTSHLRDMVRFSHHDLIRDPPFSKMDLISCRNLLIYFDETLQKEVVPMFHFALDKGGMLFLGSSESIGRFDDLFEPHVQHARIFCRRDVKSRYTLQAPPPNSASQRRVPRRRRFNGPGDLPSPRPENRAEIAALKRVAETYAPVSLLVDHEAMLLERWGPAGRFLDFPERLDRNIHLPGLARPGLRELVGPMLRDARENHRRIVSRGVEIKTQFGIIETAIVCEPIDEDAFLFVIRETGKLEPFEPDDLQDFVAEEGRVEFLEEELQQTRQRLRSTVEELETTNEELKSSNEEMMSMNEELQSTNEELTTVNDELKGKIDQVTMANADLRNFYNSTEIAALVVAKDLTLRSFSKPATDLFRITEDEVGKQLAAVTTRLDNLKHIELAREAAERGVTREDRMTITSNAGEKRELIVRSVPYRLKDDEIAGATLVFTDVTDTLSLQTQLERERERLRLALEVAQVGIWEYEPSTDATYIDETERRLLNLSDDEGDTMEPILANLVPEDRDSVNAALRRAMDGKSDFDQVFRIPVENGRTRWLHGLGRRMGKEDDARFVGVTYDVTAEREMLEQRELMLREMNHRIKNLFAVISAMVSISARESGDPAELAKSLRGRIHALAQSHALSGRRHDTSSAPLRDLIETVTAAMRDGQEVTLEGPEIVIPDSQITSIALIFHEWATNSAKYGALAVSDGKIDVSWTCEDGVLSIKWDETGTTQSEEGEAGFGSNLIDGTARQLHAEVSGKRTDTGYCRRLQFELADAPDLA